MNKMELVLVNVFFILVLMCMPMLSRAQTVARFQVSATVEYRHQIRIDDKNIECSGYEKQECRIEKKGDVVEIEY
jgi:hypothetical protein